MIDVSKYITKLEMLKEYMGIWIDCRIEEINFSNKFWTVYTETGLILYSPNTKIPIPTFESFYEIKAV